MSRRAPGVWGRIIPGLLTENQQFRRFWIGQTLSLFGDQVTLIALPLVAVLVFDAGAKDMGYLTAAGLLPYLFFPILAGAWADRRRKKRLVMILADVGRAIALAIVPLAHLLGTLSMELTYVVAFTVGIFSVLFSVSYSTLFVSLVSPNEYMAANSSLSGSRAFSYLAGPSVGGVLVQCLTAPVAIVADAASFVASGLMLLRIHPVEREPDASNGNTLMDGARFIRGSSVVRASLVAMATVNLFSYMFLALFILYATRSLNVSPALLGFVLGAGSVGGVVGSIITRRVATRIGIGRAVLLGALAYTCSSILVVAAGGPRPVVLLLLFLAEFGGGLGVMLLDISLATIFAHVVPDRLRARVSGAYLAVNNGVRPLGSLAGGFLGTALGLRPTLWIAVVGAVGGCLWLLPSPLPHLREAEAAIEE